MRNSTDYAVYPNRKREVVRQAVSGTGGACEVSQVLVRGLDGRSAPTKVEVGSGRLAKAA